jgi:hypothetical protein
MVASTVAPRSAFLGRAATDIRMDVFCKRQTRANSEQNWLQRKMKEILRQWAVNAAAAAGAEVHLQCQSVVHVNVRLLDIDW